MEGRSAGQGDTRIAPLRTQSNVIKAEKRRVQKGYGLYASESTGNSYFRSPGSDVIHEIHINNANDAPEASASQTGASASQTDHVSTQTCGPFGTQESASHAPH
ncbi:uncharacterized protein LOC130139703 [Syzygium oleosum]|uniref:uncharacterized protein LOC130139703 n=1 Tax=Syzygium oleosum TaxID=219896 RepID=UPI0024B89D18|nr:uncharacterized protein LOC130139703 [Syzygium oleosum]